MKDIIAKLPEYMEMASLYLGILVVIATALVRVPGLNKYSGDVGKVVKVIQKILSYLPTLGKNPSTAALEEKLK